MLVFAFVSATIELEALVTSDCSANEPTERPAPVRVRVPKPQILVGIELRVEAIDVRDVPSELDAAVTTLFVFASITEASDEVAVARPESVCELTDVVTPAVAVLVFESITAASDDDAVVTSLCTAKLPDESPAPVSVLVPNAQMLVGMLVRDDVIDAREAPIEDEAISVWALTAVVTPAVAVFVFASITEASDEVAVARPVSV